MLGHIVDPRTGGTFVGAPRSPCSRSSATVAEAVSTALLVLGPRAMDGLARDFGIDGCWIDRSGIRTTAGFAIQRAA
jgi:thiamine biosynthesis lipoprotein ApbE